MSAKPLYTEKDGKIMVNASKLKMIQDCTGKLKEMIGDKDLIQLAKDGILPHYIITNPITKDESMWFINTEVNEFLEENYIRYIEGHYSPNFEFIYFEKEKCKVNGEAMPDELAKITDLFKLPIANVRTPPGIYFLCKGKKIKYIGQAVNINSRILTHMSEGLKDFETVYFITCPINRLTQLESALIRYFKPELNGTCKAEPTQKDIYIVEGLIQTTLF